MFSRTTRAPRNIVTCAFRLFSKQFNTLEIPEHAELVWVCVYFEAAETHKFYRSLLIIFKFKPFILHDVFLLFFLSTCLLVRLVRFNGSQNSHCRWSESHDICQIESLSCNTLIVIKCKSIGNHHSIRADWSSILLPRWSIRMGKANNRKDIHR